MIASAPRSAASRTRRRAGWIWFALPSLVLVVLFFLIPFVLNLPFAFSSWSGYSNDIRFTGFANWILLWRSGTLSNAIIITLVYAVIAMVIQNVVALSLANTLRETTRANAFFRSLFFLPVLISPLAAGYIWRAIVAPNGGAQRCDRRVRPRVRPRMARRSRRRSRHGRLHRRLEMVRYRDARLHRLEAQLNGLA